MSTEFFTELFGDTEGVIWLAHKPTDGKWTERAYPWPDSDKVIERVCTELAPTGDVYFCTTLRKRGGRKRLSSTPARLDVLHADLDRPPADTALYADLGALRVASGGSENGWRKEHAYLKLRESVPLDRFLALESALRDALGADAKINDKDVLRPPGTLHHKRQPPAPVEVIEWWGEAWDAAELEALLSVAPRPNGPSSGTKPLDKSSTISPDAAKAWLDNHAGHMCRAVRKVAAIERTALENAEVGERHDVAMNAVMAVVRLGAEGHLGTKAAVLTLRELWAEGFTEAEARRRDVDGEWKRLVIGAVAAVASSTEPPHEWGECPAPPEPSDPSRWPSPNAPLAVAERFVREAWSSEDGELLLRRWRGDFYSYRETHWRPVTEEALHVQLAGLLRNATYIGGQKGAPTEIKWNPHPARLRPVMGMLNSVERLYLPDELEPDSDGAISLANGVLDLATAVLKPHSPQRFNLTALPFAFDADATCPRWREFLAELWPASDARELLAQWFGYAVSSRTDLQKALLLIGPTRSGKSTIARVLTALLGPRNVVTPTLAQLGGTFGRAPLIGKSMAIVTDAEAAASAAAAAIDSLKAIIGEDEATIDRKNREHWQGKLPVRFTIVANQIPPFLDPSGAMAARILPLPLFESFEGRENTKLTDELIEELPGVLNWAVRGLASLRAKGFIEPEASREMRKSIRATFAPVREFVEDCCEVGDDAEVDKAELYAEYQNWCHDNGRQPRSAMVFGSDLRAILPRVMGSGNRVWRDGERVRLFYGLRLT